MTAHPFVGPGHRAQRQSLPPAMVSRRLDEIEHDLKFDPHHPYRRQLVREYLELTDPANDNERAA